MSFIFKQIGITENTGFTSKHPRSEARDFRAIDLVESSCFQGPSSFLLSLFRPPQRVSFCPRPRSLYGGQIDGCQQQQGQNPYLFTPGRAKKASTVLLIFHRLRWLRALHSQLNHSLRITGPAKRLGVIIWLERM